MVGLKRWVVVAQTLEIGAVDRAKIQIIEGLHRYVTVDCTLDPLQAFQQALGLPPEYTHRLVESLKIEGIARIVRLNAQRAYGLASLDATPNASVATCGTKEGDCHLESPVISNPESSSHENLYVAELQPDREPPKRKLVESDFRKTRNLLGNLLEAFVLNSVIDGGHILSLPEDAARKRILAKGGPIVDTLRLDEEIRNERRLSALDEIFKNFVNPSLSSRAAAAKPDITADRKLRKFLNSRFVDSMMGSLISKVGLKGTVSVHLDTPGRNLGKALCDGAFESRSYDKESNRYVCSALQLIAAVEVCQPFQSDNCQSSPVVPLRVCDHPGLLGGSQNPVDERLHIEFSFDPSLHSNDAIPLEEGNQHYWLFRAIRALTHFVRHQVTCELPMNPKQLVPGWDPVLEIWIGGDNANETTLPLTILSQSTKNDCHFLLISRGSISEFDWLIDLSDKFEGLAGVHNPEALVHGGFQTIASAIREKVLKKLETDFAHCAHACANADGSCDTVLTVAGHSMGGGISLVLSLLLSIDLPNAKIQVATFGSPHALNEAAATIFAKRVIARNWVTEFDPVPHLPCTTPGGTSQVCELVNEESPNPLLEETLAKQSSLLVSGGIYAPTPGIVMVNSFELAKFNPKFAEFSFGEIKFDLTTKKLDLAEFTRPASIQFDEYHGCAYACYLSSSYCFADVSQFKGWLCDC